LLTNRTQLVCVNKQYSSILPVGSGISQGSILWLLLFYMNDVVDTVSLSVDLSGMYLYTDDAKLFSNNSVDLQHA